MQRQIHARMQQVNRRPPESMYELGDWLYKNLNRLHSADYYRANREWFEGMERGMHSRREYNDFIVKNAGKSPSQILKILRDLG